MNVRNSIGKWILGGFSNLSRIVGKSFFPDFFEDRQNFSSPIFMNIVELLTDLVDDTTLILKSGSPMLFAEFKVFFDFDGQLALNRLFENGFIVIAHNDAGFALMDTNQFTTNAKNEVYITDPKFKGSRVYVLKSNTYKAYQKSDKQFVYGFLTYLENTLNSSNTTTARLGTMIMATPVTPAASNAVVSLDDIDRKKMEDEISQGYGGLKSQKQIHVWGQQMAFTPVSLASLDARTLDKVKMSVEVICDRIKVPANQCAIIDAANANSLSNGGEMRQGDILKYKSYERLLNRTFINMARDLDLVIDYTIYNKPNLQVQPTTTA